MFPLSSLTKSPQAKWGLSGLAPTIFQDPLELLNGLTQNPPFLSVPINFVASGNLALLAVINSESLLNSIYLVFAQEFSLSWV